MVRLVAQMLLFLVVAASAAVKADGLVVGEYSFVVGEFEVVAADGTVRANILPGSALYEGDKISTKEGATVHLQFLDGAAVSLRPNSEMLIALYRYDADNPAASQIKLELRAGVARSISGKGAQAAKDKFRLNTPVAAIGVRGTDFVVSTTDSLMQAIVKSGGIVVASFSDNCTRESIGPCETDFAELFAGDQRAIQVTRLSEVPTLIELDQELINKLGAAKPTAASEQERPELSDGSAVGGSSGAGDTIDPPLLFGVSLLKGGAEAVIEPLLIDGNQDVSVKTGNFSGRSMGAREMVWGRWFTDVKPEDQLIVTSEQARDGRQAVLGTRNFGLYRSAGWDEVQRPLSNVEFELTGLDATLTADSRSRTVGALEGQLNVDLASSKYSTQLDLFDPEVGLIIVESTGELTGRGVFSEQSATTSLAGAIDPTAKEAGYFFEKITPQFRVDGLTLWDAK